jgi:hypothetical protein
MVFATILLLVCGVTAAALMAKAYELRQDVLYGPYVERSE